MLNKTIAFSAALVAVAAMGGIGGLPAVAQYDAPNQHQDRNSENQNSDRGSPRADQGTSPANQYEEGYRAGYGAGYDAAVHTQRYDDKPPLEVSGIRGDPGARWRQRYARSYTFNDDIYYRTCRSAPDPAGVFASALIGGLLGNAASHGGEGATVAGVIVGGSLGAAMTRNLDCDDQSYAYKAYYDGFNSGRPDSPFQWRNPSNGHYGEFRVVGYANDPDGFRCADYRQEIYINRRPQESSGRACQQPDGTWAIVG